MDKQSPLDRWMAENRGARPLDPARCPVEVTDRSNARWWVRSQCTRPPKPGVNRPVWDSHLRLNMDTNVCGIHGGVYDRAIKKAEEAAANRRIKDAKQANAESAVARLKAEFGLDADAHYAVGYRVGEGGYTGKVVVDPVQLIRLLTKEDDA